MIRTMLGGHVECRDCGCQRRHELEIELTGGRQPVE
jgi:predicted nucleic-acid-binding Zn-ribbon protein